MPIVDLDSGSFGPTVRAPGIVVVDCWASWCGACQDFAPVFERVAARCPAHTFAKLDTERHPELVEALDIKHIPALMLFRDGLLLFKQPGYFPEDQLEDIVSQAERVDMDEVRAAMAAGS